MKSDIRKQSTLIKQVFGGDKGKELLDLLDELHAIIFTSNSNEQYVRIGKHLLVQDLKFLLNISSKELDDMEHAESYDNEIDF